MTAWRPCFCLGLYVSEASVKQLAVVLANAHPIESAGFKAIAASCGIEVVGEVVSSHYLGALWDGFGASVLVMYLRDASVANSLDVLAQLSAKRPSAKVVCVGSVDRREIVHKAYEVGGMAYVPVFVAGSVLMDAVIEAAKSQKSYPKEVAEVLGDFGGDLDPRKILTDREFQVFLMIAQGLTIVEISQKKELSLKTISNTSHSIKIKLNTDRPAKLALMAVRWGYIDL